MNHPHPFIIRTAEANQPKLTEQMLGHQPEGSI